MKKEKLKIILLTNPLLAIGGMFFALLYSLFTLNEDVLVASIFFAFGMMIAEAVILKLYEEEINEIA